MFRHRCLDVADFLSVQILDSDSILIVGCVYELRDEIEGEEVRD